MWFAPLSSGMTPPGGSLESALHYPVNRSSAAQDGETARHEARMLMDKPHLLLATPPNGEFDEF
jgi:hypothetical protein